MKKQEKSKKKLFFIIFFIILTEKRSMEEENCIKKFRQRMQISTQEALAKELGVNQATISNWEDGKFLKAYEPIKRLFEMGATVEELFGIPYEINKPKADLKVSIDEAAEIVRIGMYKLIGSVGVIKNDDVLGKGA